MARRPSSADTEGPAAGATRALRSSGSWLPDSPRAAEGAVRPWRPATIRGAATRRLRYAVVDEVFGEVAELSLSGWPVIDALGRLRFVDGTTAHLEVDASRMRTFLRRHRMPRKAAGRVLRTGDAFAFVVRGSALEAFLAALPSASVGAVSERRSVLDPANWDWLTPPVYDVTPDAREAAKLSYNAALTDALPAEALDRR